MFDLGAAELLVIVIVAVLVIGPKDMPLAMRTVGRWIGQVRKVSAHFRTGVDAMVREAELEDMEKKWKAQNEEIMKRSAVSAEAAAGEPVMTGPPPVTPAIAAPVAAAGAHAPQQEPGNLSESGLSDSAGWDADDPGPSSAGDDAASSSDQKGQSQSPSSSE